MARFLFLIPFLLCSSFLLSAAAEEFEQSLTLLKNEHWWGGAIVDGHEMPFGAAYFTRDLHGDTYGNQSQPLLISNRGRFVWCEQPIDYTFSDNKLKVISQRGKILTGKAGKTLQDAYLHASQTFFPPSGGIPHELLFAKPQYNTWIELMYDQNQKDILQYAEDIIKNGFPPGVLMIDDNWQEDYGTWRFKAEKFPDPKGMVKQLHKMGFQVMLWVCPFVSADSPVYRELRGKRVLVGEDVARRKPAIIRWWNGASAVLDLTNPEGMAWFRQQLDFLQKEYGVDGFKLDAGDARFYTGDVVSFKEDISPNLHTEMFARVGLEYPLNEYRACWKMAGQPLVQRLRDKGHNWDDLRKLVPGILAQGLAGYAYTCPDLIGGGEYRSFLNLVEVDQELIVRSAQCHALMPMMQFSVAPWRVLSEDNLAVCRDMAHLHVKYADTILDLARRAAETGEPIARHMEYVFPRQGYAEIRDQFMLGENLLVAPMLQQGETQRTIYFPPGRWKSETGAIIKGPAKKVIDAPLSRLPRYKKLP